MHNETSTGINTDVSILESSVICPNFDPSYDADVSILDSLSSSAKICQDLCYDRWILICKYARITSAERLTCLLAELDNIKWNIICFSETRCSTDDVI